MTLAEAIIAEAHDRGLRHFFGIPGSGAPLDLIEAGRKTGVSFVNVSHESSAAIAAAYYGSLRDTAGLAMTIRGIGAANLAGGVANVHFERMPVVAVCETAPGSMAQRESTQQCDQKTLFDGITKFQSVLAPETAQEVIRQAFARAEEGRPGPAILHIPSDLGAHSVAPAEPASSSSPVTVPDSAALARLKEFLGSKRRPVVMAGADTARAGAAAELRALVETIGAAVLVTMDARGVFPESHPRWAGVFLGLFNPNVIETRVLDQADVVLLVGVDAMMTHALWKASSPTCELVARPEYSTLSASPVMRINGDLKSSLQGLSRLPQSGFSEDEVQALRRGILEYFKRPTRARFAAQDVIEITREILPQDGVLLSETGAFICMLEHLWPVERLGTYYGTSGGRTMGLMIPAILGARLSDSERPMIGLGADGSALMRLGELEVFARSKLAAPLVVINDRALGTMKSRQRSRGLPACGLDLHEVDLGAVARACGLLGVTVETPEAFREELRLAMKAGRTTLIDARVDPAAYQDSFGPTIGVLN
jgi:acetolactate synthase-1/2/3 large subunit